MQLFDVISHPGQRPVRRLAQRQRPLTEPGRPLGGRVLRQFRRLADEPPQPLGKAPGTLDAALGPFDVALRWRIRQHEPACDIGAVGLDDVVGIDRVALRFRHLLDRADLDRFPAVGQSRAARVAVGFNFYFRRRRPFAVGAAISLVHHHALGEQTGERLLEPDMAGRFHGAGEKSAVEQMQDRVLDAADILVDRHPAIDHRPIGGRSLDPRIGEALEIP